MDLLIKKYTKNQLQEFITSEAFKTSPNLPITTHRALSHINNPRCKETDPILYLALNKQEIVGYRIVMPDYIASQNKRIGWNSCIWVRPDLLRKGIAKRLVREALKDWDHLLFFQKAVTESKGLYLNSKHFNVHYKKGVRGYFLINPTLLQKISKSHLVQKTLQKTTSFLNNKQRKKSTSLNTSTFTITPIETFNSSHQPLIEIAQEENPFKRTIEDLNWILQYPWVLQEPENDNEKERFHFSSSTKEFKHHIVEIKDKKNALQGILWLKIRDGHLTTPYLFLNPLNNSIYPFVVHYIFQLITSNNYHTFSTFNTSLIQQVKKSPSPFLFTKKITKNIGYPTKMADFFGQKNPHLASQDGDGDSVFT